MLTDTQVRAAKPGPRPRRLSDGEGLYLQIDPNGRRYWRLNYRHLDKQKTLALWVYPAVSVARARERLAEAKGQLADGIDPGNVKTTASTTFEKVASCEGLSHAGLSKLPSVCSRTADRS